MREFTEFHGRLRRVAVGDADLGDVLRDVGRRNVRTHAFRGESAEAEKQVGALVAWCQHWRERPHRTRG